MIKISTQSVTKFAIEIDSTIATEKDSKELLSLLENLKTDPIITLMSLLKKPPCRHCQPDMYDRNDL